MQHLLINSKKKIEMLTLEEFAVVSRELKKLKGGLFMKDYILVLITAGSIKEGEKIACALVEEGLAACCNIIPGIRSVFKWKGEVCKENEVLLMVKSKASIFEKLKERVKKLHSYEVPEIIAFSIKDGLQTYLNWVDEVLEA
ncbi:MAG: divalent-cation tolerance protein CutA [Deltaproteobacteria bacterium]